MPLNKAVIVSEQSRFYRNNFRKLLISIFVLLGIAYLLLGIIIYQHFTKPIPRYFATTSDGRLIEIKPISE